ncbi:MAG TPA: hypothetical protein VL095_10990 [Flavisolibacter sp.]|nr:hypothetical protein [Flavisolibacter sp.]
METKQTVNEEMKLLIGQKDDTCISIILPLHHLTIDQKADKLHLSKAVKEVCDRLQTINAEASDGFISSLHKLMDEIEFDRKDEGIALYVSETISFYTTFPFAVAETIAIEKSFRLKELLLKEQYAIPYNLLYLDEHEIRLFTGKLGELKEIRNGEFPMIYEANYEYQPPSHSSSLAGYPHVKSFEREKTQVEKFRHEAFIQQANEQLHNYFQNSEVLLLCGISRYTSAFLNRTAHAGKIIGVLNGNYNRFDEAEFARMTWPSIEAYIYEKTVDEISEYNEKIGEGLAEEGIIAVWDAISSGRGETLLVEKNYAVKGYLANSNPWELLLQPPKRKHTVLEDAVNRLLEMLLEKNGRVIFTEDKMLESHGHIALITRYGFFS